MEPKILRCEVEAVLEGAVAVVVGHCEGVGVIEGEAVQQAVAVVVNALGLDPGEVFWFAFAIGTIAVYFLCDGASIIWQHGYRAE